MYNIILPIRFALLRDRDRDMFEWLLQYMDHNEERRKSNPEVHSSTLRMADILCSCFTWLSKDLAVRLIGILFTNCFEFQLSDIQARALYPLVSLVNHSCIPNMRHSNIINTFSGGEIVVMKLEAQRTIPKGTELTIRYTDYLMSQSQRQRFLKCQWYFQCRCPRCSDPTEFGSLTSSLPCTSCHQSNILPLIQEDGWQCKNCDTRLTAQEISFREDELVRKANQRPEPYNIRTCLQQLQTFSKILHNNHF